MASIIFVDFDSFFRAVFLKYCYMLPLLIIFFGLTLNANGRIPFLMAVENNAAINLLGKMSYGLYMYHGFVIVFFASIPSIEQSMIWKPICVTMGTIVLSSISFFLMEKPILCLKAHFQSVSSGYSQKPYWNVNPV